MTQPNDIVTWLRAIWDEDERAAPRVHELDCELSMTAGYSGPCTCGVPARLLAEVDAKRQILDDLTARRLDPNEPDGGWEAADAETDGMASGVVRLLALPYANRDGYRPEWRPA